MFLKTFDKTTCSGCRACEYECPKQAISMYADDEGFLYPRIDMDLCVQCEKCEKACSFSRNVPETNINQVYAAYHKDDILRNESSSGGVFYPLAISVLENNGIVIGAGFNDDFSVLHKPVSEEEELRQLMRSKYVQSDLKGIYQRIEKELNKGKPVLFSGTPCQVAGIRACFNDAYDNLYLCEVLCYGVPSPKVYERYLNYLIEKYHSAIAYINFKDKRYGWDYYTTSINFKSGKSFCRFGGDSYSEFFRKRLSIRYSCFQCPFSLANSYADISLGDFYHYEKYTTLEAPKNGISCVIIRNMRGEQLFDKIKESLIYEQVDADSYYCNEKKNGKIAIPEERNSFFQELNQCGYSSCIHKYSEKTALNKKIKRGIQSIRLRLR